MIVLETQYKQLYKKEMYEIYMRIKLIERLHDKFNHLQPVIEFKALQLRCLIEHIFMLSLVTNASVYEEFSNRLYREWQIDAICREIKKMNLDYFPRPCQITGDTIIEHISDQYIQQDELIALHGQMGNYVHACNPFKDILTKEHYTDIEKLIDSSCMRIYTLMKVHITHLYNLQNFYIGVLPNNEQTEAKIFICNIEDEKIARDQLLYRIEGDKAIKQQRNC